jgi:hypothetical protein
MTPDPKELAAVKADRDDWKARALKSELVGEPTPNDVVAGALYDFLGYLTSRRTRVTMSDRDEAGPAVDALVDWSKTRKITLEEARVEDWQNYTTQPQPAAQQRESCTWTEQDDKDMPGTYASSCGEIWSFIDGGVKENRVTYCHHCGGKVVPASPQEQT